MDLYANKSLPQEQIEILQLLLALCNKFFISSNFVHQGDVSVDILKLPQTPDIAFPSTLNDTAFFAIGQNQFLNFIFLFFISRKLVFFNTRLFVKTNTVILYLSS